MYYIFINQLVIKHQWHSYEQLDSQSGHTRHSCPVIISSFCLYNTCYKHFLKTFFIFSLLVFLHSRAFTLVFMTLLTNCVKMVIVNMMALIRRFYEKYNIVKYFQSDGLLRQKTKTKAYFNFTLWTRSFGKKENMSYAQTRTCFLNST